MTAPHAHNDIEINFCAAPLTYDAAGGVYEAPADIPVAFWGSRPHQLVEISAEEPHNFVTVPLAQFMSWGVPAGVKKMLLQGLILVGPRDVSWADLPFAFDRWTRDLSDRRDPAVRAVELEVEALILRMTLGEWASATSEHPRPSLDLRRAADMATYLTENMARPVRVTDVADVVHLHPNRAAAIFRHVFGVGIVRYLSQLRVAEAQRLLLTTDLSSEAVGSRAGFGSASSFHQVFLAECGSSPLRWRQEHRGSTERARVPSQ
ncbi:helix-turn-helix domain-containing protein [Microbacterium sp. 4R-513]|uniref:helix-turn-helix domain-containing protein n=1 Tax=Microbacterium sp. 4R-513 TaxID=2567934 RepID=UPI0013E174EA|nr:helix-turn-helix domain-containing protein [Microbacterium sp. 4R-513]QIG39403.1 helix-turn-helix domain-containing protein [Microbacterium sp. 4R-513]